MDQSQVGRTGENLNGGIFQFPEGYQSQEVNPTPDNTAGQQAIGGAAISGIFSAPEVLASQVPDIPDTPDTPDTQPVQSMQPTPAMPEVAPQPEMAQNMNQTMAPQSTEVMPGMITPSPEAAPAYVPAPQTDYRPLSADGSTEGKHFKTKIDMNGDVIDRRSERIVREEIDRLKKDPYEQSNARDRMMVKVMEENWGRIFGNDDIGEIQAEAARVVEAKQAA